MPFTPKQTQRHTCIAIKAIDAAKNTRLRVLSLKTTGRKIPSFQVVSQTHSSNFLQPMHNTFHNQPDKTPCISHLVLGKNLNWQNLGGFWIYKALSELVSQYYQTFLGYPKEVLLVCLSPSFTLSLSSTTQLPCWGGTSRENLCQVGNWVHLSWNGYVKRNRQIGDQAIDWQQCSKLARHKSFR